MASGLSLSVRFIGHAKLKHVFERYGKSATDSVLSVYPPSALFQRVDRRSRTVSSNQRS